MVDMGGKLVWSADEKTSLFSEHYAAKQCRDGFQQPYSCDPSLVLCSVGFRISSIHRWLLNVDPHGGMIPIKCFYFFTNR